MDVFQLNPLRTDQVHLIVLEYSQQQKVKGMWKTGKLNNRMSVDNYQKFIDNPI